MYGSVSSQKKVRGIGTTHLTKKNDKKNRRMVCQKIFYKGISCYLKRIQLIWIGGTSGFRGTETPERILVQLLKRPFRQTQS